MKRKNLLCALSLVLLLTMLLGCVYYLPAPNEPEDESESTAEQTTATEDTTNLPESETSDESTTGTETAAPTDRDPGYTGYH